MTSDTENWIKNCRRCIRRKSKTDVRAPLVNITSHYPLELVCIDYLTLEPSQGNISNILVITDHFTRFGVAIPTKNQTAKTTADVLYREFIVRYGIPARLYSDQGTNFESQLIKELCDLMGIKKSRTTPYHAAGNGMTERFNRTLISMLGTLEEVKKKNWKQFLAPLVHAYNCIRHESTGYFPYQLLFGREPRLPVDIAFGLKDTQEVDVTYMEYITDLQKNVQEAFEKVQKNADKARQKQKSVYDLKAKAAKLEIGDRVLVKILAFDGKHKIADKWTKDIYIYIVTDIPNLNIPVYKVEREDGKGGERMLHRNNLLHLGSCLADEVKEPDKNKSSVDSEGLTNSSRATPTPAPRNLKKLPTPKPRNNKVEIETEKEEDDSLFVVTETTDKCENEIEEVDDALAVDLATNTQDNNVSTHETSDIMDNEDAHDPDQTDEGENVVAEEETSVKTVLEPRRPLPADDTETEGNTSVDTSLNAAGNIRRSTRFRQKPLWQRQGDFLMPITERSVVLQSL